MTIPDYTHLRPKTNWRPVPSPALDANTHMISFGCFIQPASDPLRVLVSVDLYEDTGIMDGHWLHLSISRSRRLPTWGDLCAARDALGYKEVLFVQLVPPASAWLNMHSHCLHLFHRLDGDTVPSSLWRQADADGTHYGRRGSLV
jgi:hypothetical protein